MNDIDDDKIRTMLILKYGSMSAACLKCLGWDQETPTFTEDETRIIYKWLNINTYGNRE